MGVIGLDIRRALRAWRDWSVERLRWLDRPVVRWVLLVAGWTLWVLARMWTAAPVDRNRRRYDFWVGFLMGLTLWAHFLTVSVWIVVAAYVLLFAWLYRREAGWMSLLYASLGGLMGLTPVIVWNAYHGWLSITLGRMIIAEMTAGDLGGPASFWLRAPHNL